MKKFFSLIALVGVFAACQPEDLNTAFSLGNAEATINVTVINTIDGANVTGQSTITGNTVAPSEAGIPRQDITVSATYQGATGSTTVTIGPVLGGAKATYNVVVYIPGAIGDYTISTKAGDAVDSFNLMWLKDTKEHGIPYSYSYKGYEVNVMLENANEFVLVDKAKYVTYSGYEYANVVVVDSRFKSIVENIAKTDSEIVETEVEEEFQVSAWAVYNFFNLITTTTKPIQIIATPNGNVPTVGENGVIGTFNEVTKSSQAGKVELAHPDHASHYEAGHGHGHGAGNNAGGGLVDAE